MKDIPSPYASPAEAEAAIAGRLAEAREARATREAAEAESSGLSLKSKLAIGGIALTGVAYASGSLGQAVDTVRNVFGSINSASHNAAAGHPDVPSTPDGIVRNAEGQIQAIHKANHAHDANAAREQRQP